VLPECQLENKTKMNYPGIQNEREGTDPHQLIQF
jgi:hypothetical protein